jgi:tRNA A-37 threonylcarbamoyl transferase component Bud32
MIAGDVPEALLEAVRRAGLDSVDGAFAYEGGADLSKPGLGHRRRTRIELPGGQGSAHVLYLKRYGPQRLSEALRRWWTNGRRRSPARVEFENIRAARLAGVPTMQAVACGEDRCPLGACRSYLIVTAVPGEALERCFDAYLAAHDAAAVAELTGRLAGMVRRLHQAGYVHRDLYASHVFLDASGGRDDLYLIDLARMFRPRVIKRRWFVKDLAQLKYSMSAAWVDGYWQPLLADYLAGVSDRRRRAWDELIGRKVESMRRRGDRRRRRSKEGSPQ